MLTAHVNDEYNFRKPTLVLHDTEHPNFEGRLAIALVERWGLVAANDGGEDSSGRSRLKLQDPAEVVERACSTAALLTEELRKRGWFIEIPSWDEMTTIAAEQRRKNEEKEEAERTERASRKR